MAEPIKVLHVVLSLEQGGMENGVVNVANRLDPEAFDVRFCCLERRGEFADRLLRPQVTVLDKPPGKSLRTAWRLNRLIARARPHVIHTHNLAPLIYGAAATLRGITCPILHGVHSEMPTQEQTPKRLQLRQRFYRASKLVQTVTIGLTRHLEELGLGVRPIETVTNGVDTSVFSPDNPSEIRAEFAIPEDAFVVGMVARFGAWKRQLDMLQSFAEIAVEHKDVHIVFVGTGGPNEQEVSERCTASPFADRLHLAGFRAQPELVYPAFDMLAIPSIREGLSNASLEAMASGVPVLTHNACGAADVITDGEDGWVADVASVPDLTAAMRRVLSDRPRLADIKARVRGSVEARFSMESMVEGYAELYRRIARR
ncbi:MAG: glycosyltransferase involved in cell wall biosynthesis [Rhodothermales bacterium]|jgi:glycosyltransferase involved in cell wall biosynthesis